MARQRGVVLTYVDSLDTLADCVRLGNYDVVKVVTAWGLGRSWEDADRKRVMDMVPNLIVRTKSGDPSYARPFDPLSNKPLAGATGANAKYWDYDFLNPDMVVEEITPWYGLKPDIMIELGNEPNVFNTDDDFIWRWAFNLDVTIKRCRQAFPQATLISPGFMMDPNGRTRRFYEIGKAQIAACDYVGVHFYEYYGFKPEKANTHHLRDAVALHQEFFPDMAWYVTEYGINDTKEISRAEKGKRYANLLHSDGGFPALPVNVAGAVYYHLQTKGDIHPEYHIYPDGDQAYCAICATLPAEGDVLGGAIEEAPALEPVAAVAAGIAALAVELADLERELLALRAAALASADGGFGPAEESRLRQIRQMRKGLEHALEAAVD